MSEFRYPTVDIEFIEEQIIATGRLEKNGIEKFLNYHQYTIAGNQVLYKRRVTARFDEHGQVKMEPAIGMALRFRFLMAITDWLEKNRNWKDGGYFNPGNKL